MFSVLHRDRSGFVVQLGPLTPGLGATEFQLPVGITLSASRDRTAEPDAFRKGFAELPALTSNEICRSKEKTFRRSTDDISGRNRERSNAGCWGGCTAATAPARHFILTCTDESNRPGSVNPADGPIGERWEVAEAPMRSSWRSGLPICELPFSGVIRSSGCGGARRAGFAG